MKKKGAVARAFTITFYGIRLQRDVCNLLLLFTLFRG